MTKFNELKKVVLTEEIMKRMGIPKRFWRVDFDKITASVIDKEENLGILLVNYLNNWEHIWEEGVGLLLSGPNGTGKTSAVAWLAKEFRRVSKAALFLPASMVFGHKVEKTRWPHDESYSYWQKALEIPVLILDDFGKGGDASGHTAIMWDELLRIRSAEKLITIITSNLPIEASSATGSVGIDLILKRSTIDVMKENMIPIAIYNENQRELKIDRNMEYLNAQ